MFIPAAVGPLGMTRWRVGFWVASEFVVILKELSGAVSCT